MAALMQKRLGLQAMAGYKGAKGAGGARPAGLLLTRGIADTAVTHPEGLTHRISSYFMPQEGTWADEGTHHAKKKLDIWDHMAMAVGPRPDTVTSDNIRSSRADADVRLFNPGSPVDLETNEPREAIVPQTTGCNLTPTDCYDDTFDIKYFQRDTRVVQTLALSQRQTLLASGEEGAAKAASPTSGIPPRPPSFGLKGVWNGRTATNGPMDGS